ncbi:hypothetical protein O6H91_09G017200 [Diphasiastrum complanatum]|uniref:Uncharacterized protein n=1 Tax=Diphasiastrum complanatum TaxID=34168 RepID=A0ACC2CLR4_DIPCM|nr:hypothetical protein O6H91_09G017200 [Diphasiastrum complanatum]
MDKVLHGTRSSWGSYQSLSVPPCSTQSVGTSLRLRKDTKATLVAQGCMIMFAVLVVGACVLRARQLHSRSDDVYFLSLGNHCCGSAAQKAVAMQMGVTAEEYKTKFVVSLGNDFNIGPLFGTRFSVMNFQDVFTSHPSLRIPWYMAVGDYYKPEGHIMYANISEYLIMPAPYFTKKILLPSGGSIDIVFLHTKTLLYDQVQEQWLERSLANNTANWCITVGHHLPENQLRDLLLPLFLQYGVDAYIYGHDYVGQYSEDAGVAYIGNGVGGCSQGLPKIQDQALWTRLDYDGFILHRVSTLQMEFMFMDTKGNILERIIIQGKKKARSR